MSAATVNERSELYWSTVLDEVAELRGSPVESQEIPVRSNESSRTYGLNFEGVGGYPLFAYLSVPVNGEISVPLLQTPNYGSVVGVPVHERRSRYAVLALCHRGQRLSDSIYRAAYPGLLTDGLPGAETYRFREIVADCLRAVDVLLSRPEVDGSRLAVSGNDLAALVASLNMDVKTVMVVTPLLFSGVVERLTGDDEYPLQEHNDFRRSSPGDWDEATSTLELFNPVARASKISTSTLIACSSVEKPAAAALARGIQAEADVYVNTGYSFLDHKAQEDWLADQSGVERSEGPFLPG